MLTDDQLAFASMATIGRLFRSRKLSPVELTRYLLARIERINPQLNAFLLVSTELALKQAKRAESELAKGKGRTARNDRGPLHGIPVSLKDNISTAGIRTTAGSQILRDFVPGQNAPVVDALEHAGAIVIGKTNMHEFAYGASNVNPHFGPSHNPWDLRRITGGSSGGSAAALAARFMLRKHRKRYRRLDSDSLFALRYSRLKTKFWRGQHGNGRASGTNPRCGRPHGQDHSRPPLALERDLP